MGFDKRYGRPVLDKSGMGQEKSAVTPGGKEAMSTAENAEKKVLGHGYSKSRLSLTSLECASSMCGVRYDTTFATKEVMREASNPTMGSLQKVKRITRIPQRATAMLAEFPLGSGKIKHVDSHR